MIKQKHWIKYIKSLQVKEKSSKEKIKEKIVSTIKESMPKKRFGIMFSGGIDSSLIALICRKAKANFICYSVGLEGSQDLEYAKKAAKAMKLNLKYKEYTLKQAEEIIKTTSHILGKKYANVVNVGVGSVVVAAALLATKNRIKVFYSGLGSEEIFAGYERHRVKDINKECWNGLLAMYERDLIRDQFISEALGITLITPFLSPEIIRSAMNIPGKRKLNSKYKKIILREIAEELGLKKEFSWRKKKAAQYGSKFDRAILRLAKQNGFKYKKDYIDSLF
ncbi:MAG: hypothetical protein KAU20_02610 [Nanoarchaeota archaeon]|nr:hypothetical protein [Nanoarchaeota archaeon]